MSRMMDNRGTLAAAIGAIICCGVFGILTITSIVRQSPTIDEPVHLLGGYSYLKWGDYRVNPEHPPLVKMWAALPLLWLGVNDPRGSNPTWNEILITEPGGPVYPFAQEMFFKRNDAARLFFYAKFQMLLLSTVLAIFIYIWSRELFGITAGLVALFLYSLDPNILAHSAIIHTDLPFAAIFFIGTYFLYRAFSEPTRVNLSLTALSFGLAAITKHSFVAILPVWLILGLIKVLKREPQGLTVFERTTFALNRKQKLLLLSGVLGGAVVVAYLLIWMAYGFRFSAVPGGGARLFMTQIPQDQKPVVHAIQSFLTEHHAFPEALISGYLYNLKIWKHSAYLLGEISGDGFWSYFPIAFAVKTPLPTLILLGLSLGLCASKKKWQPQIWLLIPVLVYFALAVFSRFNIGVRHLLPIYPFLFVLIGSAVADLWRQGSRIARGGLMILALWSLWSTLSVWPHYLAYFNELAGGPKNGHKVLLDSNLDWGQDLKGLKQWIDRNGVTKVQLIYFGTADAKYYGIDDFYSPENLAARNLSGNQEIELPEYLVISANFLYGGEIFLPEALEERFGAYRSRQPDASVGQSLLIYRLNLADSRMYVDGAMIAARKGMLNVAMALLQRSLKLNPTNADAYFQLANLMVRQGQPDDALIQYRRAVNIKPDFAEAYRNLGRVLAAQGRSDEATQYFREALRVKPEFAEAHENLAQALARQGRADEAARHYQEALRILKQRRDTEASRP